MSPPDGGVAPAEEDADHALAQIWRDAHDLMIVTDLETVLLAVNPAWEALLGPLPAGRRVRPMDFQHPDEDPAPHLPENEPLRFRRRYLALGGRTIHVSWTLSRKGARLFGVGRDDTALVEAEERLRQTEKMDAVGQLTGGIAHDFNNLLTIVLGNLEIAARRLGPAGEPRITRAIAAASEGAQRAATLTQRLLAFARRQPLMPRAIDPARHLDELLPLVERAVGEGMEIAIERGDDLGTLRVDPGQLENAVLNLAVNARDATGGSGRVTIALAAFGPEDPEVIDEAPAPGPYIRLTVRDDGPGMTAAVRARAFEPFFTTKPVGRGTGLGLSQVHGFVVQSGGFVTIEAEPGAGTAVHLWLPRSDDAADDPAIALPSAAAESGGGLRLLVAEDNDALREMVVAVLREAGYSVIEAHDGRAALSLFKRQSPFPRIVVSDVMMPGLDGIALAAEIRARSPGTGVLLMTGFTDTMPEADDGALLLKPFTPDQLLARVEALAGGAAH